VAKINETEFLASMHTDQDRRAAFERLVRDYKEAVYFHIRRMVLNHDDANDLTQEVFIKVWRSMDRFRGESKLYTWLYRIATNACLTHLEKNKRFYNVSFDDVENQLQQALREDPLFTADDILLRLQVALASLPDKQRAVFVMRYYDELSYAEIAEITGTSEGALKASYHHAAKKIEAHLTHHSTL
jgi:RNA polymerase sigma-70 factor (ECF subfamily)